MKSFMVKTTALIVLMACFIACVSVASAAKMPENMIVDEEQWQAWKSSNNCGLTSFSRVGSKELDFTYTLPSGQESSHKKVEFVFKDKDDAPLENVEMYYYVYDGCIEYLGLWTEKESVFKSKDFREACIRLMMSYNVHYDSESQSVVLNITRKRAEEVVDYCLKNIEHCLVDDMRIRVIRDKEDKYYSFHMEY